MIRTQYYKGEILSYINNGDYMTTIRQVQRTVYKIWCGEVLIVKEFTDHSYKHSHRILDKLWMLLSGDTPTGKKKIELLTEEELYLLILGVFLHDIGMQCDVKKYPKIKEIAETEFSADFKELFQGSYDPLSADVSAVRYSQDEELMIRKNHAALTAASLTYGFENNDYYLYECLCGIEEEFRGDLIDICRYHSKLLINDCPKKSDVSDIRLQLVATLLRFGDELEIDSKRVMPDTPEIFGLEWVNPRFWYIHGKTKIQMNGNLLSIKVFLTNHDYEELQTKPDYDHSLQKNYVDAFFVKNKNLMDILCDYGITVIKDDESGVSAYRYAKPIPAEHLLAAKHLDKSQDELREMLKNKEIN